MNSVAARRAMILRLIERRQVRTQTQLLRLLAKQNIETTQTTLSRDIAALGLRKMKGRYRSAVTTLTPAELTAQVKGRILAVMQAGPHLVVIRTPTGEASPVGLQLDRAGWPELVGTVAGDDTIFAACTDPASSRRMIKRLRELAPEAFI